MSKQKIYLDYAATTPVAPEVLQSMLPYYSQIYGNYSSLHSFGQEAAQAVEKAREAVASFLHCQSSEVFFTSGATECNNLALLGMCRPGDHFITTSIEHPSVLEVGMALKKRGVEVTYLPVLSNGIVDERVLFDNIKENTRLISVMYVNNEIGTIEPVEKIGARLATLNKDRKNKIYFHIDAVQAAFYLNCDVAFLGADLLSLSGHKIYGPKGVGALFMKQGTPLQPVMFGGHQEKNVRPGTLNVPLLVGLGTAVGEVAKKDIQREQIKKLRDKIIQEILSQIPQVLLNGDLENRVGGNVNFSFLKAEGESVLIMLDMEGIAVSTGSACSSGSLKPSHVLAALGRSPEESHGSIRITLGQYTTEKEVTKLLKILPTVISKIRKMAPEY